MGRNQRATDVQIPYGHYLDYGDWWSPILARPLCVEHGMAMGKRAAGNGVSWNEKAGTRFACER